MVDTSEKPFTLSVPEADLELLRKKLELVRLPDELDGANWDYGAPLADIKRLVTHWKDSYDWRKSEAEINKLPMFTRDIEVDGHGSLNIHYIHQKSEVKNAIPLLFVHGWPGDFLEVRKMLPLLTAKSEGNPSFHVVALSLPGFGFSEAPKKPGFAGPQYAEVFNKLMLALGYDEYVYQGGDWGYILGLHAVTHYAHKHIKAWHTNMPSYRPPTLLGNPLLYLSSLFLSWDKDAMAGLKKTAQWRTKGMGYFMEQATKPQTLGYNLADSPVGLLAWIYEKLVGWTDNYPWTDDEVIEWISVYWFSRAGPTAAGRIYYEMTGGQTRPPSAGSQWQSIPLGVSYFPAEISQLPKSWSHMIGNLVFESTHDKGGHFAAFEQPEKLAGDLHKMYGKGGPAHGVVPGKNGYD
ncbi:alpha/beta-hydrolase [Trametes versicolor FP-101664 SS1]|uniref:alpha/beta-hydrolase n=1 Tax=Trametes versicolor (strain FP-101664) TaxID=717944 RepID=UPI0004624878|nr:alpha/beta-hydrolase [Trametes versicolor FP-101664 SS1]EIW59623.1 alpha/beta-hydrolase [Trametes versicolor FP-101664 SS1]